MNQSTPFSYECFSIFHVGSFCEQWNPVKLIHVNACFKWGFLDAFLLAMFAKSSLLQNSSIYFSVSIQTSLAL